MGEHWQRKGRHADAKPERHVGPRRPVLRAPVRLGVGDSFIDIEPSLPDEDL